jgi:alpha-L-fucosidase
MQPNPSKQTAISLLGAPGLTLDFQFKADALHISFPSILPFNALAGKGAWTIKLTNVM